MIQLPFFDRVEAGRLLGAELTGRHFRAEVVVLGLARGGVPVAYEVATALNVPLDVVVVRKLGVPWEPEFAMGALAGGRVRTLDETLIRQLGISEAEVDAVVKRESAEVERREVLYRMGRQKLDLRGRIVILVDDGLATGSSMLAAIHYAQSFRPAEVIAAVPVGAAEACRLIEKAGCECVCLAKPYPFHAVGEWYEDFRQIADGEVTRLLEQGRVPRGAVSATPTTATRN
jgi:predicted phosphoribosyltransferase